MVEPACCFMSSVISRGAFLHSFDAALLPQVVALALLFVRNCMGCGGVAIGVTARAKVGHHVVVAPTSPCPQACCGSVWLL
jgi:hypothetical protein